MDFAIKAFSETNCGIAIAPEKQSSGAIRKRVDAVGYATLKIGSFITVPFHRYLQNFA
ncbi:MAG: hypothetical protein V7L02_11055 [Nostoc sp.]|uniref:hypothetical protein n=1 Tax=Nostoc sp. TaxID=1180 RepID=UPI002FFBE486